MSKLRRLSYLPSRRWTTGQCPICPVDIAAASFTQRVLVSGNTEFVSHFMSQRLLGLPYRLSKSFHHIPGCVMLSIAIKFDMIVIGMARLRFDQVRYLAPAAIRRLLTRLWCDNEPAVPVFSGKVFHNVRIYRILLYASYRYTNSTQQ